MLCLTGDVHHEYGDSDQQHYSGSEFEAAIEYVDIAQSYGIDVTLFLTGVVAEENAQQVRALHNTDGVEIGGHTWNAFRPQWLHYGMFSRILGNPYGPKLYQSRDINRTLQTLADLLEDPIRSWRTHAYGSNDATYDILSSTSVEYVSDRLAPERNGPFEYDRYDLTEYPINVITDHEHLFHGSRTQDSVTQLQESGWSDPFGSESYPVAEWKEKVLTKIEEINRTAGVATTLIHPGCMKAVDDLDVFEDICVLVAEQDIETKTLYAAKQAGASDSA